MKPLLPVLALYVGATQLPSTDPPAMPESEIQQGLELHESHPNGFEVPYANIPQNVLDFMAKLPAVPSDFDVASAAEALYIQAIQSSPAKNNLGYPTGSVQFDQYTITATSLTNTRNPDFFTITLLRQDPRVGFQYIYPGPRGEVGISSAPPSSLGGLPEEQKKAFGMKILADAYLLVSDSTNN